MIWPPIPREVDGLLGPIRVDMVEQPIGYDGEECDGTWCPERRLIEVKRSPSPLNEWFTFRHEEFHGLISDRGLVMRLSLEEALCDAYATFRVREMQRGQ